MTWVVSFLGLFLHFSLFQSKQLRRLTLLISVIYLLVKTWNNIKTVDFFCDIWTMEFIKVIHIVKLWLDAMPKSVVAHSISMTSRRKTTIQGVSTGRAWIWCDAATIAGAAPRTMGQKTKICSKTSITILNIDLFLLNKTYKISSWIFKLHLTISMFLHTGLVSLIHCYWTDLRGLAHCAPFIVEHSVHMEDVS